MSREVRCLTDDVFFLGQRVSPVLADDDETACDADASPHPRLAAAAQVTQRSDDAQRGMNCPFGIILMGARITEQRHDAVAKVI